MAGHFLRGSPLPWLLEPDQENPAVRSFALRDLLGQAEEDAEVCQARAEIVDSRPVPAILAAQGVENEMVVQTYANRLPFLASIFVYRNGQVAQGFYAGSDPRRLLTRAVVQAGRQLDIDTLDHQVIGRGRFGESGDSGRSSQ
ncbi:MAG: hypothetical protein ROW52_08435 [Anaerolineaceae bacterium]|jgi:hypothetical protein